MARLVVYPSSADWDGLVAQRPGLPASVMAGITEWIGIGVEAEGEAL
jgi:hypothetical protein